MNLSDKLQKGIADFFAARPSFALIMQMTEALNSFRALQAAQVQIKTEPAEEVQSITCATFVTPKKRTAAPPQPSTSNASSTPALEPASPASPESPLDNILRTSEIPREEIECDIETMLISYMKDNLKSIKTNLNGYKATKYGKKYGFPEVFEMKASQELYPVKISQKRGRNDDVAAGLSTNSCGSPLTSRNCAGPSTSRDCAGPSTSRDCAGPSTSSNCAGPSTSSNCAGPSTSRCATPEGNATKKIKLESGAVEVHHKVELAPMLQLRMQRTKLVGSHKPKIEVSEKDLTYNPKMIRHFHGASNRTEEQQEQREKNCKAARLSRLKNKSYESILAKESRTQFIENINVKRQVACMKVYAQKLISQFKLDQVDIDAMLNKNILDLGMSFE